MGEVRPALRRWPAQGGRLIGRSRSGLRIQVYVADHRGIATAFTLYETFP